VSKSSPTDKSFQIPKQLVWEAYKRVKANKGAAGVDGQSIEDFEKDLRGNLYKIWNRMSSGTYFPPPVRAHGRSKIVDHGVRPRSWNGRCMFRPAHRVASEMSRRPAKCSAPIPRLRRPAMTRGPERVWAREWSSR